MKTDRLRAINTPRRVEVELGAAGLPVMVRSEEHTSELQSHSDLVCRLLLEKKKNNVANQRPYSHDASAPTLRDAFTLYKYSFINHYTNTPYIVRNNRTPTAHTTANHNLSCVQ